MYGNKVFVMNKRKSTRRISMTEWWKDKVVYQIYPRSFKDSNNDGIGDINGIREKIPYLAKLGINIIWLSPVYQSPNDDNGYDISDYYEVMTEFGTMEDFENLLKETEKYDIKIMMDLVVNHTSDEHQWFIESRSSRENPYRDYYIWKDPRPDGSAPNNWGAAFGGSVWEYDEETNQYYLHLFSRKQPDLNWENEQLRNDIYQMMLFWLDKGVGGFRMDVINMISKDPTFSDGEVRANGWGDGGPYYFNGPKIHDYLKEMHQKVLTLHETITVGETPGVNIHQAKLYTDPKRKELDMVFNFEHVGLGEGQYGKWTPTEWKLTELKSIFTEWQTGLDEVGWNSLYWSNHDQPRAISRYGNDREEYRVRSGKMLATCLHLLKGTPYIYQGEEIGMTNVRFASIDQYRDIELLNHYEELTSKGHLTHEEMLYGIHERSRDNARTPMQWNNQKFAGFSDVEPWIPVNPNYQTIHAEEVLKDRESLFYYYQKLIQLRKEWPIIVEGKYSILLPEDEEVYAYTRSYNEQIILVLCNFTDKKVEKTLGAAFDMSKARTLIKNLDKDPYLENDRFELEPYQAIAYLF
jgi:oligo-1,6-glucosidase